MLGNVHKAQVLSFRSAFTDVSARKIGFRYFCYSILRFFS